MWELGTGCDLKIVKINSTGEDEIYKELWYTV